MRLPPPRRVVLLPAADVGDAVLPVNGGGCGEADGVVGGELSTSSSINAVWLRSSTGWINSFRPLVSGNWSVEPDRLLRELAAPTLPGGGMGETVRHFLMILLGTSWSAGSNIFLAR